jgi:hypothetical protein
MPRHTAYSANPLIPDEAIQDRAILEHNARVVGATFLPTPPVRYAPGSADHTLPYKPVFFGADREYADDEGWQTVHGTGAGGPRYQRKNRKQRKWREIENPLVAKEGAATAEGTPRLRYREVGRKSKPVN